MGYFQTLLPFADLSQWAVRAQQQDDFLNPPLFEVKDRSYRQRHPANRLPGARMDGVEDCAKRFYEFSVFRGR